MFIFCFFFFKQKTAYEMRISDWSSDVCSSDLYKEAIDDKDFVSSLVDGVLEHQDDLDAKLQPMAPGWPLDQIARIDRNVLRIGLYELLYKADTEIGRASCRERVGQYV